MSSSPPLVSSPPPKFTSLRKYPVEVNLKKVEPDEASLDVEQEDVVLAPREDAADVALAAYDEREES